MEDNEEWEEEQLVLVELCGILETEVLHEATTEHCRLLGINTSEPVLQIGPYTFVGEHEDAIGTNVFFEEVQGDDSEKKRFQFKGMTTKSIKMVRAFLKQTAEEDDMPVEVEQNSTEESFGEQN
ncbi:general transcription factor 3C polypeptide 6-like [Actinia tenebrosa]|uniref:General transcription factor 3C polypeptide 6-like n=1 Tax=Actinia tenebrosa TaxID=6105 RepID=A0A6P8II41_ACTTE|nr:general transcription factor 3C polypeptide 6-like [Actinia tenebrosa]